MKFIHSFIHSFMIVQFCSIMEGFLHPTNFIWRVTYCKQVEVLLVNTVFILPKDSSLNILGYKGVFVAQNISTLVPFSRDGPNTRGPP